MSTYCVALRRNNRAKVKQKELHAGGIIVPIISFQTEIREKSIYAVLFCFVLFFGFFFPNNACMDSWLYEIFKSRTFNENIPCKQEVFFSRRNNAGDH